MDRRMTDREVYPAIWIVLAGLAAAFFTWKYLLHEPTVSRCWFYQTWKLYCPGCGGTRALEALGKGNLMQSLWFHPAVPIVVLWATVYMTSQTTWRLRKKNGWVLHYDQRWPKWLVWLLAGNWICRNLLLLGFGISL